MIPQSSLTTLFLTLFILVFSTTDFNTFIYVVLINCLVGLDSARVSSPYVNSRLTIVFYLLGLLSLGIYLLFHTTSLSVPALVALFCVCMFTSSIRFLLLETYFVSFNKEQPRACDRINGLNQGILCESQCYLQ